MSKSPFVTIEAEEELGPPAREEELALEPLGPAALVSSLLFVSPKPLSRDLLVQLSALPEEVVDQALAEIQALFQEEVHGFSLIAVTGGYQFRSAPAASEALRQLMRRRTRRLSRAAAETLAVIAYKQPVQRSEIESIRGVDALPTLRTLLDARLVRVVGHHDGPGQPALYGTTEYFLERFGLSDLSHLPGLRELEAVMNDPGESESGEVPATDEELDN